MNIVAILANGVGSRFDSNVPKQFHKVNGKMVIEYVIDSVFDSEKADKIVIATNVEANSVYLADIYQKNNIDLIEGGSTRNRTLKNVLEYINSNYDCHSLIVCDAVRPMITGDLIDKYFDILCASDAVVTAQKITDSLGCYKFQKVNREDYYLMQSPEGFQFKLLYDNFDSESVLTEVTQQLPKDSKIELYFGFNNNIKLTFPADLKYLEALIKNRKNEVVADSIFDNVARLKSYLEKYYPNETKSWTETLNDKITALLKKWQIEDYKVIKTSHFGIILVAESIMYGKCVLKIIPPFIGRYQQERSCYQSINASFMCELLDYDDNCSAILLECCDEVKNFDNSDVLSLFEKVTSSAVNKYAENKDTFYHNYSAILHNKVNETDFAYKNDLIMSYVNKAIDVFDNSFSTADFTLVHGDLHRFNIMSKNGNLVAIDPIGYIAPKEIDVARFVGTELTDNDCDIYAEYNRLVNMFSSICDREKLKNACFVDMVFRLHNSLFENENYTLTDKWLKVLESID